jgi:hypothetical protein
VPQIIQGSARMRGAWKYQSPVLAQIDSMAYIPFRSGDKLLANAHGTLYDAQSATVAPSVGPVPISYQNPAFHRDRVIIPAADGVSSAVLVTLSGTTFSINPVGSGALTGRYATTFKDRVVLANSNGQPQQVAFCPAGNPTIAWDPISVVNTTFPITGLAVQRTQVLAFHASTVERLRGTVPPDSTLTDQKGDLITDFLFARAGCYDARSIAYWDDNVLFADARGMHVTDGATVKNLAHQTGVLSAWQDAFSRGGNPPDSIAGVVYHDYYFCTVRHTGYVPITFLVDLSEYRSFQFTNLDCAAYAYSIGTVEKLYGTDVNRVTDLTPLLHPDPTILQIDADGQPVLPTLATGFSRLTNGVGFKRVTDMRLVYEAHRDDDLEVLRAYYINAPTGDDQLLGEFRPSNKYVERKIVAVEYRAVSVVDHFVPIDRAAAFSARPRINFERVRF